MQIHDIKLSALREYENNPRHNENAVDAVAESIKQFGFKVPIVVSRTEDGHFEIIAGHTRRKAAELLNLDTVPCLIADDLTPAQVKAFRIADNKTAELAAWDFIALEKELADLENSFDMTDFGFADLTELKNELDSGNDENDTAKSTLAERFVVPPFSILDTRQGYWQDRKRQWKDLGIKSESGRDAKAYTTECIAEKYGRQSQNGTSIFDSVLCELAYRWFCTDGGKIYDCFAGGSVRGIVAAKLGYDYHGIDLRQEQIDANIANAKEIGVSPHWYCDDSLNADKYIADDSCDMIFSCPPYADLEVYSDDPRDISNMNYDDFCKVYADIIAIACKKLKQDRFAVFVVGDIRDKKGFYRNFIDYTKKCFIGNGLFTYNELVLIESVGTGAVRAANCMKNRKVVKTHQNVVVMYKGNPKNIKINFEEIEMNGGVFDDFKN